MLNSWRKSRSFTNEACRDIANSMDILGGRQKINFYSVVRLTSQHVLEVELMKELDTNVPTLLSILSAPFFKPQTA